MKTIIYDSICISLTLEVVNGKHTGGIVLSKQRGKVKIKRIYTKQQFVVVGRT